MRCFLFAADDVDLHVALPPLAEFASLIVLGACRYNRDDPVSVKVKVTAPPPAPDALHSMDMVTADAGQTRIV
jgi:hypothetical protein